MRLYWDNPENHEAFCKIMEEVRSRPGWVEAIANTMRNHWSNRAYHDQVTATQKKRWENPEVHKNVVAALNRWWRDPVNQESFAIAMAEVRSREGYGERISKKMKEWWSDPIWAHNTLKASREGIRKFGPNFSEMRLGEILETNFPGTFAFNGNGKDVLTIGRRTPDFICKTSTHVILEMFGIFWHAPETDVERVTYFEKFGYKCEIFWEDDVWCNEPLIVQRVTELLSCST